MSLHVFKVRPSALGCTRPNSLPSGSQRQPCLDLTAVSPHVKQAVRSAPSKEAAENGGYAKQLRVLGFSQPNTYFGESWLKLLSWRHQKHSRAKEASGIKGRVSFQRTSIIHSVLEANGSAGIHRGVVEGPVDLAQLHRIRVYGT